MSWKNQFFLGNLSAVLFGIVLVGCGSGPTESTDNSEPAESTAQTGSAEQIVLAIGGESEEGYDPTLGWGRYGSPLFQSTLLKRDADLNIVNDLATDYTVSEDGLTWTITIREDAVFSDGEPLTAADVAYTFNQATESGGLTDVTVLDEAVAVDDTTVELRLEEPQSTFVNRLITLGIVPEHAHGPDYARNPIGSGPYQMVQWDEGAAHCRGQSQLRRRSSRHRSPRLSIFGRGCGLCGGQSGRGAGGECAPSASGTRC